ncbi:MAG: heavy-metal-associated domain-containing protein [Armatimonadetes bacterium]|nr:heavy-metal-associated domain-containing protein [Armatimonadota bacterium]
MGILTLKSEDIHCESCVASVTKAVSAVGGVKAVKVDLESKVVEVAYDPPADPSAIESAMDEAGFEVVK